MSRRTQRYNRKVDMAIDAMMDDLGAAATGDIVKAIDAKLRFASSSEDVASDHRIAAARMYVALRERIEEGGTNWWKWHKGNFDRSRKDAELLLQIGGAADPAATLERKRASARDGMAKRRAVNNGDVNGTVAHLLVKRFEKGLKELNRHQQQEVWSALHQLEDKWHGEVDAENTDRDEGAGQHAAAGH